MKLVYKDIYEIIDESMSDSQIGSRKGKNIRNHVWVLNSIICDTLSAKKTNQLRYKFIITNNALIACG